MADGDGDSGEAGSGDPNVTEEGNPYLPQRMSGPSIPHYYGDYVRQLFMLNAAAMLVFSPFLSSATPSALMFEIGGAIVIAILGGLTNAKRTISMIANSAASGIGIATYELLALSAYAEGAMLAFIVRESIALGFLFALYFSLKTLRNMLLRKVGKRDTFGEFSND